MKSREVLWEEIFPREIEQIKWKDLNAQENTPPPAYKHMQTNQISRKQTEIQSHIDLYLWCPYEAPQNCENSLNISRCELLFLKIGTCKDILSQWADYEDDYEIATVGTFKNSNNGISVTLLNRSLSKEEEEH